MHQRVKFYNALILLLMLIGLLGCSNRQKQPELTVFSAMSLTDVLTEIGEQFTAKHGVQVYCNFAASSTLQRQLEKGASADVFISASPKQVIALEARGMLEAGSRYDVLANRLVIVSYKTAAFPVETVDTLTGPAISRIAVGQPMVVPAGTYAKEALTHFGVWEKIYPKLVFGTDVRATLAYVAAGNADIAIVYQTDITLSESVKVLYQFPAETHTPIIYPAVILKDSQRKETAQQFVAYLKTARATEIFEKHGFNCLSPASAQRGVSTTLQ